VQARVAERITTQPSLRTLVPEVDCLPTLAQMGQLQVRIVQKSAKNNRSGRQTARRGPWVKLLKLLEEVGAPERIRTSGLLLRRQKTKAYIVDSTLCLLGLRAPNQGCSALVVYLVVYPPSGRHKVQFSDRSDLPNIQLSFSESPL
jgi:hypothetical protein